MMESILKKGGVWGCVFMGLASVYGGFEDRIGAITGHVEALSLFERDQPGQGVLGNQQPNQPVDAFRALEVELIEGPGMGNQTVLQGPDQQEMQLTWDERLIQAVREGDVDGVLMALQNGANPDLMAYRERRVYQSINGVLEVTVQQVPFRLLHLAIKLGNTDIVQLLCDYRADVNIRDEAGRTALWVVASNNNRAMMDLLCQYGADIHAVDNEGHSLLYYVMITLPRESDVRRMEGLYFLLEHGVPMGAMTIDALCAAGVESGEMLLVLLANGKRAGDLLKKDKTDPNFKVLSFMAFRLLIGNYGEGRKNYPLFIQQLIEIYKVKGVEGLHLLQGLLEGLIYLRDSIIPALKWKMHNKDNVLMGEQIECVKAALVDLKAELNRNVLMARL